MYKFLCVFACLLAACNAGYHKPAALPALQPNPAALLAIDATDVALGNLALSLRPPTGPIALPIAAPYSAPIPLPPLAPAPVYGVRAPILAPARIHAPRLAYGAPAPIVAPALGYAAQAVIPPARIISPAYSPLPGPVAGPVYANPAILGAPIHAAGRAY